MLNIKKILSIVLAFSLVLSAAQMPHVYATPIFGTPLDLNGSTSSFVPHIAASGSKVYAVWSDNSDIWSTFADDATTAGSVNVSNLGGTPTTPKIAIGTSAYVVWGDTVDNKIYFEKNTTGNNVFGNTPTELISTGTNSEPRIAASGDNVYVVWKDNTGKISYRASSNGATSFEAKVDLSSTGTDPQIAASGSTAYIVWRDTSSGSSGGIRLAVVSSAGGAASATASLSTNAVSSTPQIAASGTTAYVVWADSTPSGSNGDILFSTVSNTGVISVNGANISSNTGTSAKPQIAVDGSDVYVTWQDTITSSSTNDEILFKHSTDSGANFGSQVNLSNTSTSSTLPSIAVSGSNVNVVWKDGVANTSTILFKPSSNKGDIFGGLKNLSASPSHTSSTVPQVVASGGRAHATWTSTVSSDTHAFLISGTSSTKDIRFDSSQYTSNAATITVRNSTTSDDFVTAVIKSATDTTGVTLRLNETSANNGNFTGQITFDAQTSSTGTCSSGCHLQAASGANLTATYLGQTANAFMPTRTMSFGFTTYTLTNGGLYPGITISSVIITLTDSSANTNAAERESVDVTVTSTSQSSGITLSLKETGVNTGVFRNSKLIFTTGTAQYSVGDALTITVDRSGESGTFTTASATIASTTSPLTTSASRAFLLNLTETGTGTEIFTGTLNLAATTNTATNTIGVTAGDILSITNSNSETTNALIIPNSNSTIGSIQAAAGDTITATSSGTTATATISSGPGSGGGGGGVVRPTVIVNVVAAVSSLYGTSSPAPPIVGAASLVSLGDPAQGLAGTIGNTDLNSISSTQTAKTGEKLSFQLDINNGAGIDYLTHVELGVNNKGLANVASDTSIIYDKFASPQITIVDPHKLFANAKFTILPKDPRNGVLKFEITFAKPMDTSDIRLLAWDINRNFMQKYYEDAIKIEQSDKTSPVLTKTQDKIDTNQVQQKIKPQKVIQKENKKDPIDKKTQKTEFDKLKKKTTDKKKTKNDLVKKLQNKIIKTNAKTK